MADLDYARRPVQPIHRSHDELAEGRSPTLVPGLSRGGRVRYCLRPSPQAHSRCRRRAVAAGAAGHRPAARRIRSPARRKRRSRPGGAEPRAAGPPDLRHQDAGHERRRGVARGEGVGRVPARNHDDRLREHRDGRGGDAPGRLRLPDQAVRPRRAEAEGAREARRATAPPGERAAEARPEADPRLRGHHRPERQHAGGLRSGRVGGEDDQHGAGDG